MIVRSSLLASAWALSVSLLLLPSAQAQQHVDTKKMTPGQLYQHKMKMDYYRSRGLPLNAKLPAEYKPKTRKQCHDICYGKYDEATAYYCYYNRLRCPTLP